MVDILTKTPLEVKKTSEELIAALTERVETLEHARLGRIWRLIFRFGNVAPLEKVFRFNGDLRAAKDVAFKHCQVMGYIFIIVKPYEVDLLEQEKIKKESVEWNDEAVNNFRSHKF